jgi:hypothetical protein
MTLNLSWVKCGDDGHWCALDSVNLDKVDTEGIYIIWHEGNPSRVVRVGQGDIKDRLTKHRTDKKITAYSKNGTLRVTWASVSSFYRDGVERHLANTWNPLVGDAFPDCQPIAVNSPWK